MDLNFFSSCYYFVLSLLCVWVCPPPPIQVFISDVLEKVALVVFLSLAVTI